MKNFKAMAIAALLAGFPAAGNAQPVTLSDLKAQGATRVAKDELGALVKGATLRWTASTGPQYQIHLDEDGSFAGNLKDYSRTGKGVTLSGTWEVASDGKFCRVQLYKGQTDRYCWVVSKLGDKCTITLPATPPRLNSPSAIKSRKAQSVWSLSTHADRRGSGL